MPPWPNVLMSLLPSRWSGKGSASTVYHLDGIRSAVLPWIDFFPLFAPLRRLAMDGGEGADK